MSDILEWFHLGLRYSHIVLGFLGLVLFWVPVFARKGGRLHIRTGQIFAGLAYIVAGTAIISSLWAVVHPASFLGVHSARIDETKLTYATENLRFFFVLLFYLGLGTLAGNHYGLRLVRTRETHERLRSPGVLGLEGAFGLTSIGLVGFGVWNLVLGYTGQHLLSAAAINKYWLHVMLGIVGVFGTWSDLRYILRPRPSPMAWWYAHMEAMLGVGIAFHTAFAVFGANRLFSLDLPGAWKLVPWILPSAIGIPATSLWTRSYRRKFGELSDTTKSAESLGENPACVS